MARPSEAFPDLQAKAFVLAETCQAAAARGDCAADAAAFEELLLVLADIAAIEEEILLPQVNLVVLRPS